MTEHTDAKSDAKPAGRTTRKKRKRERYSVRVYAVMQMLFAARDGRPNVQLIAVKLSRKAAERVVARVPGTFIVSRHADNK